MSHTTPPSTSRAVRVLAALTGAALLCTGLGVVLAIGSGGAEAETLNPSSVLHGFTIVSAGDADLQHGSSGGEIEGSLAAGGNLRFGTYNLTAPTAAGSVLPSLDGGDLQLLVGGTLAIDSGSRKLDLNAGRARITDTSGMQVSPDRRLYRDDLQRYLLNQSSHPQSTVGNPSSSADYSTTPDTFTNAFPATLFPMLSEASGHLAGLTAADGVNMVTPINDGGKWRITLVAGLANVLDTDAAALAGISEVNFAGPTPNQSTPFIINVSSRNGTSVVTPRFNGGTAHFAQFVLWNFAGWSSLTLGAGGAEMGGGVLAPDADLLFQRTTLFEGQIVAKSITIRGSAEIHHWPFIPEVPFPPTPTPSPTPTPTVEPEPASGNVVFTDETCLTIGEASYLVSPGSHVSYTLTLGNVDSPVEAGTQRPVQFGQTYLITASADPGYELVGPSRWSHRFLPAEGCLPTHPLTYGMVTVSHASCTGDTNSFTVIESEGVEYRQSLDGTTTVIEPGTFTTPKLVSPYSITAVATGDYALDENYPETWTFTFAEASGCGLPTLSFTGISPWWLVALSGGIASVVLGTALILVYRRQLAIG